MQILYQDNRILVCIKPAGVVSTDEPGGMPDLIRDHLGDECACVRAVHRLDQAVGGVMVYARTKQAAASLSRAIQEGQMVKEYVAMVHGTPPETGDWEDLLFKDSAKNKVFGVGRMRGGVKKARLEYRLLRAGETSLVRIRLHTGRSHQIRVQFASRGYPLVGDHKYGSRDEANAPMLFSCRLTFPYRGKMRSFEAYPPWADAKEAI